MGIRVHRRLHLRLGLFAALLAAGPAWAGAQPQPLSDAALLAMAGDRYASGDLPLGDGHYVTDGPRKGYIYLCHLMQGMGGAQASGPWIHGASWSRFKKIYIQGAVYWNEARFSDAIEDQERILAGNGLPLNHPTGIFPVQASDPAYAYDRNPNAIHAQNLRDALPVSPVYSDTPYCMGGEAGIMLTGVALFNGFDAGMRDAAAHEVQDSCQGHPQVEGQYHYHSLSSCIKDVGVKTVIGYALDGFPITGPQVAPGKYLITDNLDECHGLTSEIIEDGKPKMTYHYVMTQDFPYSVSCFRAHPTRIGPSNGPRQGRGPDIGSMMHRQKGMGRLPPPEALSACNGKNMRAACSFVSPRGDTISGTCHAPPAMPLACMPAFR